MRRRCVKMSEVAFCCLICDMWGSSRETDVHTASRNSSATDGARSDRLCKPALDIEARDWICVEMGGTSEVSLLRLRCASLCLFTMGRCEALT